MTDLNKTIEYVFRLSDQISETAAKAAEDLDAADAQVDRLVQSEQEAQAEIDRTDSKMQGQQITIMTQLTALMGMREAVSAVTSGLVGMGLVSDETAVALQKVNAAFSIMAGAVTAIKSVQAVMTTLNAASAANAVINTYNAVISNPAMLAGVGIAVGAAAGVAGMYLMSTDNSTSTTTINVTDTTPQQATSELYQVVGGGAL